MEALKITEKIFRENAFEQKKKKPWLNLTTGKALVGLRTTGPRREDGSIKPLVYRKATHTDQYLSFQSHHPLQHTLAVIRTLLERSDSIVTEEEDRKQEEEHIRTALHTCGYPDWAIKKVKEQMKRKKAIRKDKPKKDKAQEKSRGVVTVPYSFTEKIQWLNLKQPSDRF